MAPGLGTRAIGQSSRRGASAPSADRKCDDTTGETTTNMVVESRFFYFPRPSKRRCVYGHTSLVVDWL